MSAKVRVVRPLPTPTRWLAGARGKVVLQPALQFRAGDDGAWVLMAWWRDSLVPHYLTPADSLWANGLDHQSWFHESFSVFVTRDEAKAAGDARRWGEDWEYLELAQVQVRAGDVYLIPEQDLASSRTVLCA